MNERAPLCLASATAAWSPALSPDGSKIAYISDRDGAPRVWLHDRQSGSERLLPNAPESVRRVHWSIEGDWLALAVAPSGTPRTQVWVIRRDGQDLHCIPGSPGGASFLGPWTHEQGVLALAHTTPDAGEGVACLENAYTGQSRVIARGGQPVVLEGWTNESAGIARVRYRGASWDARVPQGVPHPETGATLYIEGQEGSVLVVAATRPQ